MKRICAVIMIGVLLVMAFSTRGAVYRWKDQHGKTHYSSALPSSPVKHLEIKQKDYWIPYSAEHASTPQPIPPSCATVAYRKSQSVMTIPVTLNQSLTRIFAIDTGASYTIISHEIAKTLQLQPNPELAPLTLQTANGQIQAPLVNIETLTVGELTSYNIVAAIHDVQDGDSISGLLGLNFLNRFTMTVDSTQQQITFTPVTATSAFHTHDCVAAREWVLQGTRLNDGSEEEAWMYQQAIALCPDLLEAYYRLGSVYYQQHDHQRAIDLHQRLLQLAPEEAEAHYRLGVLYMLERQFVLARAAFQKTLQLFPSHPQAQEYLKQLQNDR
jgi:clan AA aspartic protease (TIGR02281 family)